MSDRRTGGVPYKYRFTLEGHHTLEDYLQNAVEAGFYGVDDDPTHPAFTQDNEVWRKWKGIIS